MKNGIIESDEIGNLRRQAEERLKDGRSDPASSKGESKDALALVHELQVHQIELEMQNEELKLSKLETEDALVKYSDLYDFAPIGLFAFDAEGLIQEVNLAGAKLLGVERRNLMSRHFQLFVAPKDRHFFDDFCKKAFETSIKQTCELNLLRDGKPAVHARIEGIAAEDGPLNGRQCRIAAIDITERKQAEKALQQSEQRYRNLFESMDEGFALCEMIYDEAGKPVDFRYLNVNPSFARLTGLSERVAGKTVRELIPGIEPFWVETYGRVVQSGLSERIDNSVAALGRHYEVYVWRSGIGRFAAIFNDITERKRMENELSETRDYLENLINHANAPIIVWDAFSRITRFNHAFERLTGLRAAEALGEPLSILFPENSQEESLDYIGRTLSGERWDAVEIPILGTDGSVRTVLWNSANIYGKDGTTVVSTIAQGQDITERKWMEEELRKARDELERRVQERIAELSKAKENLEVINEKLQVEITEHEQLEKELIKAKEAAEAAVEAKAAFLANMSHELRTPMNAVIGYSSLLLDDNLTPEQNDYVEGIRNGGEALISIISDILEFSRAEKEKVELEHQPLSLKHCIEESLDIVAVQSKQKGLNLAYTVSYGTPDTIIGDQGRLRQILANLLSNAVKFTDEGEVSVFVSSKDVEGNKRQITFAVKDTGIGMPRDKMQRLFKPFTQLEYKISRKRDGVGLGLAISKELVELMDGEIWVESEPNQGSTFRFTIQAEVATCKHEDLEETSDDTAYKNLSGQNPLAILVAEDNPSNQRVIVEMLRRMGYRPDAVADGREVLQVLKIRPYDLILMDIKMPEMDGITATEEIRRLWPAAEQSYIVAITAFAMEGDREKCLDAGMDDYIAKPVQKKDLEDILMKYSEGPARRQFM